MIVFSIHRSWRIITAGSQHILAACQCGKFLPDPMLELEAVLHIVGAEQVVELEESRSMTFTLGM